MNNRLRDIPKSRAFTTGFRLFTAVAAAGLTAALIGGLQTCEPELRGWVYPPVRCNGSQGLMDSFLGPLTLGWKGGVGDHAVFAVFVGLAGAALFLAGFLTAFRDADPTSVAEAARTEVPPPVNPPAVPSYWPALSVVALAVTATGLVLNPATFVAGLLLLGVCVLMWTIRTWAERSTGDDRVNESARERIAFGIEVPAVALVLAGAMAISVSRVLLSVSDTQAVAAAGVMAAVFFAAGVAFAYIPRIGKDVIAVIAVVGALVVIGSGLVSAASGEREFEHSDNGHSEEGALVGTDLQAP